MLKNKKVIYLLITLVILIWGLIFYKIYSKFGGEKYVEKNSHQTVIAVERVCCDSLYILSLNYPDPFLKGRQSLAKTSVQNTSSRIVVPWPFIEFRGILNNSNKSERTGFVKIKNSNFLVKQGEIYSAIKVQTIFRDSILLVYQNEKRWFRIMM